MIMRTPAHQHVTPAHSVIRVATVISGCKVPGQCVVAEGVMEGMSFRLTDILLMVCRGVVVVEMGIGISIDVVVGEVHRLLGDSIGGWKVRGLKVCGGCMSESVGGVCEGTVGGAADSIQPMGTILKIK